MVRKFAVALAGLSLAFSTPVEALTARDILVQAAFQTTDKQAAIAKLNQVMAMTATASDPESQLQHATAIGYHAKLTRSPSEAKQSRAMFERLVAANPRDAEAQLMLGGWHLDAVAEGFLTASFLSAKKAIGLAAVDRAVALGGDRAFFKGLAAMMRIRLDPGDVGTALTLASAASIAPTPTNLDRIAKREAEALLIPLKAGDGRAAAALAHKLLPFGRIQ
jgi:hypothetical protein